MSKYRVLPDAPPPTVAKVSPQLLNWLDILHDVVNGTMAGNLNVVGSSPLTLAPGVTTTTINDARIGGTSVILLQPMTANAAAAIPTTWISTPGKTTVTINHANSAQTDRTFQYVIIG